MSKGSKQRPTDKKKYEENWDRVFMKKNCPHVTVETGMIKIKNERFGFTLYTSLFAPQKCWCGSNVIK